jgi:hypothetical protein
LAREGQKQVDLGTSRAAIKARLRAGGCNREERLDHETFPASTGDGMAKDVFQRREAQQRMNQAAALRLWSRIP